MVAEQQRQHKDQGQGQDLYPQKPLTGEYRLSETMVPAAAAAAASAAASSSLKHLRDRSTQGQSTSEVTVLGDLLDDNSHNNNNNNSEEQ